jgi:ribokinase
VTRVVVIGDATLDVTVAPTEAMRHGGDVAAAIRLAPGGQGANVAVRLARRGVDVDLVCGMATDPAAMILLAALAADGVRVTAAPVDGTPTVIIHLDDAGERSMLSHRRPFAASAVPAVAPNATWVVVSGYLLLEPEAQAFAASLARHTGRRVLLGCSVPAPAIDAWRAAAAALRPDLAILNRDEAAAAGEGLAPGVVVTDADGASATIDGVTVELHHSALDAATDSTGAGDAFAAALVACLADRPWPPDRDALTAAMTDALALAAAVAHSAGAQARVAGERPPRANP